MNKKNKLDINEYYAKEILERTFFNRDTIFVLDSPDLRFYDDNSYGIEVVTIGDFDIHKWLKSKNNFILGKHKPIVDYKNETYFELVEKAKIPTFSKLKKTFEEEIKKKYLKRNTYKLEKIDLYIEIYVDRLNKMDKKFIEDTIISIEKDKRSKYQEYYIKTITEIYSLRNKKVIKISKDLDIVSYYYATTLALQDKF